MKTFQRRPILRKVALAGLSIGSVGSLMSCGLFPSEETNGSSGTGDTTDDTTPADDTTPGDSEDSGDSPTADLIIDTTDSSYSVLANTGGSLALNGVNGIPSPGILVYRSGSTSVNVVSRYCTHQGCTVDSNYVCPCHNSKFANDGSVLQGPASSSLTTYSATVSGTNILINFS